MSVAEAILRAAEMCIRQGASPNIVYVNARDYARLEEYQWSWEVEEQIDRVAKTYHERTTLLSMMHAAWRLFSRRGRQFDARSWWQARRWQP